MTDISGDERAKIAGLEREAERLRVYWRPIASAPKDGSCFLIERDLPSDNTMSFAFWHDGQDTPGWVHAVTGIAVDLNIYTMWRPKPSGPAQTVSSGACDTKRTEERE